MFRDCIDGMPWVKLNPWQSLFVTSGQVLFAPLSRDSRNQPLACLVGLRLFVSMRKIQRGPVMCFDLQPHEALQKFVFFDRLTFARLPAEFSGLFGSFSKLPLGPLDSCNSRNGWPFCVELLPRKRFSPANSACSTFLFSQTSIEPSPKMHGLQ